MPLLASYQYQYPVSGNWAVRGGASLGVTREKFKGYYWGGAGSENAFTYGLSTGVSYSLTKTISLDADALVLGLEETDFTTQGSIVLFTVGVNFGF